MATSGLLVITGLDAIYTPEVEPNGARHLLIASQQIGAFLSDAQLEQLSQLNLATVLDGTGLVAVPGFIDMHMHVSGGGGEAGPASRTPEAQLSQILSAGITTVVGVLGTDAVTRSQEALVAKCRSLQQEGISCYHWCGSYRLPAATVTGSVLREVSLMEGCLGVGEVAVSDHRGSVPTPLQLATLASEARVGGMLGGSAGLVHCHMGPGKALLSPLREAMEASSGDIQITQFLPTHMDRSPQLVADGERWLLDGGWLDFTCSSEATPNALAMYSAKGLPLSRCTVSTDAYGSLPKFDSRGQLVEYDVADPGAMLRFLGSMHFAPLTWPLQHILPFITSNPAAVLKLPAKGHIKPGCDADVLLLEAGSLEVCYVVAKGQVVKTPEWVRGGCFERGPGIRPWKPP